MSSYNIKIWCHYMQLVYLGDQDALLQLARLTFYGINNVKQNLNLSFKFIKMAADVGNIDAINIIGYMYIKGIGTEVNKDKGLYYLLQAANNGNSDAQYSLSCYFDFIENNYLSEEYLQQSAKNGNAKAKLKMMESELKTLNNKYKMMESELKTLNLNRKRKKQIH